MILEGEIKDAKMSSFSSEFQTSWIIDELGKEHSGSQNEIVPFLKDPLKNV